MKGYVEVSENLVIPFSSELISIKKTSLCFLTVNTIFQTYSATDAENLTFIGCTAYTSPRLDNLTQCISQFLKCSENILRVPSLIS